MGLLLGCPLPDNVLQRLASILSSLIFFQRDKDVGLNGGDDRLGDGDASATTSATNATQTTTTATERPAEGAAEGAAAEVEAVEAAPAGPNFSIFRVSCPSLHTFQTTYMDHTQPVILTDCMTEWPALQLWPQTEYLERVAGDRTVPIEIGRDYLDAAWTQSLMLLRDFIRNHVVG